jgi:hypothetical protein
MSILEDLLVALKSSRSESAGPGPTQIWDQLMYSEPELSRGSQLSGAVIEISSDAQSATQSEDRFDRMPALPLEPLSHPSSLQRIATLPDHEQAESNKQSTSDNAMLSNTDLNRRQSDLPDINSSCSGGGEAVNAPSNVLDYSTAEALITQHSVDWTSNTSASVDGDEESCIYSVDTVFVHRLDEDELG